MKFTTTDNDNNERSGDNCATIYTKVEIGIKTISVLISTNNHQ